MCERLTVGWFGSLAMLASLTAPGAHAQSAKPPQVYSAMVVNAMMGPSMIMKIDRDGALAVVETTMTPASPSGQANHTRTYYDLQKGKNYTVDLGNPSALCGGGNFAGDWGDLFEMSGELMKELAAQNPRQTGTETVNGFATKVMETTTGADKAKVWVDTKYGLAVKVQVGPKTIIEVKTLSLAKPAASLFVVPAACTVSAPNPEAERFAAETGGNVDDFGSAITGPGSPNSCSVLLRMVRAGSMQPITSGFQMAIDTDVNPDQMATYSGPRGVNEHVTFSGGAIHEVTAQFRNGALRIDNVPLQFHIETSFGDAGASSANLYRNCISPQTVLLMVIRNPANIGQGVDWLWVKSGKFTSGK